MNDLWKKVLEFFLQLQAGDELQLKIDEEFTRQRKKRLFANEI